MIKRLQRGCLAFAALALWATSAAASSALFNTGVDSSGNVLAGSSFDNNWTLSGSITGQPVVLSGNGGAFFVWTANDATGSPGSAWIGLTNNTAPMTPPGGITPSTSSLGGPYFFSQSFMVSNPSAAVLMGTWWIDDAGSLLVNGNVVDSESNASCVGTCPGYTGVAFTVPTADFVTGLNTIQVEMTNGDGLWDGTRVAFSDIEGITAATPLPATVPLFATGLGALGLLGWRRKRKAQAIT